MKSEAFIVSGKCVPLASVASVNVPNTGNASNKWLFGCSMVCKGNEYVNLCFLVFADMCRPLRSTGDWRTSRPSILGVKWVDPDHEASPRVPILSEGTVQISVSPREELDTPSHRSQSPETTIQGASTLQGASFESEMQDFGREVSEEGGLGGRRARGWGRL